MPELVVYRLLDPALRLPEPVQIICESGKPDELLAQLALHQLDVVLVDAPVGPFVKVRAFNHLLGECGVSCVGTAKLAAKYRPDFPRSLEGAPFLLPPHNAVLRRSLDQWFATEGIHPNVRGEFTDPAMLKVFGEKRSGHLRRTDGCRTRNAPAVQRQTPWPNRIDPRAVLRHLARTATQASGRRGHHRSGPRELFASG